MVATTLIFFALISLTISLEEPVVVPQELNTIEPPPVICGVNEVYNRCASLCDTTCDTLGQTCDRVSLNWCTPRCECIKGHARNSYGLCVPYDQCFYTTNCPKNEVYRFNVSDNPRQVDCRSLYYGDWKKGPGDYPVNYYPTCVCKPGYIRSDVREKCIRPQECCTEPNTVLVRNASACPGNTCAQPAFTKCDIKPFDYGCQCRRGYVMRSEYENRTCIRLSEC
ncbi:uncharacterized protein LOC143915894 [Arctopsyche grandis]|uniref:uncharacterized protein LOC143915894 n=1 Tax=Arctopsyche grandis TaxID=121162 RepID=UPI00406D91EE